MRIVNIDLRRAVLSFPVLVVMIACAVPCLAAETAPQPQNVGALVQKIIDAYGGKAVLDKVRALSARAVLESPVIEGPVSYTIDVREDRKLRVEKRAAGYYELRLLNGQEGYYQSTGAAPFSVSGPRLLAMVYQFKAKPKADELFDPAFLPRPADRRSN